MDTRDVLGGPPTDLGHNDRLDRAWDCNMTTGYLALARARLARDRQIIQDFPAEETALISADNAAAQQESNARTARDAAQADVDRLIGLVQPCIVDVRDGDSRSNGKPTAGQGTAIYSSTPQCRALVAQLGAARQRLANAQGGLAAATASHANADNQLASARHAEATVAAEIPRLERGISRAERWEPHVC
jgi:hypothetical protein